MKALLLSFWFTFKNPKRARHAAAPLAFEGHMQALHVRLDQASTKLDGILIRLENATSARERRHLHAVKG